MAESNRLFIRRLDRVVPIARVPVLLVAVCFCLALITASAPAQGRRRHKPHPTPTPRAAPVLESETQVHAYDVSIYRDEHGCGGAYFEIKRGYHLEYTSRPLCDAVLRVGAAAPDDPDERFLAPGHNLTGAGHPDLVVTGYTPNASCCLTFYMFELEPKFRSLGKIQLRNDDPASPHFVRLRPGGEQIVLHDWTFAGWHTDFADSPAPLVILEYCDGGWRVASDLMREPAPSPEHLQSNANNTRVDAMAANYEDPFRAWPDARMPSELWAHMLNLIYTGHPDLAWKFADLAWPARIRGKNHFLAAFRAQLAQSPYWEGIKQIAASPSPTATPTPANKL
ncbi:MAG: hypothetical protein ACYDC3_14675 [Candidatus Binataceae bacterium]